MSDKLFEEILDIQDQYKSLLLSVREAKNDPHFFSLLDEVAVFWKENLKKVDLLIRHLPANRLKYFFTASTFMDIEDYEHYAFVALGAIHIFDDPLPSLIIKDQSFDLCSKSHHVTNEINRLVTDNIKVLEEGSGIILILPIRMLYDKYAANSNTDTVEDFFLGLFSDVKTFSNYMTDINSIQDIEQHLRPEIVNAIIFCPDTVDASFQERFRKARLYYNLDFAANMSDSEFFHMIVRGYLEQCHRIIMISLAYDIIPYLRDSVALFYLVLILNNLKSCNEVDFLTNQSILANIFYNQFDKGEIIESGFPAYCEMLRYIQFNQRLEVILKRYEIINEEQDIVAATIEIKNLLRTLYAEIPKLTPTPRTVDPTTTSTDV